MTQTRDLIKKMADFFKGEEFYEKGEDARLELSPDDVRCICYLIQQIRKDKEDIKREIKDIKVILDEYIQKLCILSTSTI